MNLACIALVLLASMSATHFTHALPTHAKRGTHTRSVAPSRVVCYYPNWAQHRPAAGKYTVADIDPSICTHINFAFANIVDNHLEPSQHNDLEAYQQLNELKGVNPRLTTMLSVGGYSMGPKPFEEVCSSVANMEEFAQNAISYLRRHGFDGLDVDWEFPDGNHKDKFTLLHRVLMKQFEAESVVTGDARLLLSTVFGTSPELIYNVYDSSNIHKHVDFANVMTYDFHGFWGCPSSTRTGFHSALYGDPWYDLASQNWTVSKYVEDGFPKDKFVLGVPSYGRSFTLCDESEHGIGYPACAAGQPGRYTNAEGMLAYYEICLMVKHAGYTEVYSDAQQVPYAYKGDQWVGYDNVESVTQKVNFAYTMGLGGVVFWELASDDFKNFCGGGKYPLIKITGSPPPTTTTTTTVAPTTIPQWVVCEEDDQYIRDIRDCSVYYHCANGVAYRKECADGTVFDTFENICNWPDNVDCSMNPTPPPTTTTPRSTPSDGVSTTIPPEIVCEEDGSYIRDPEDCAVYYVCSNGVPHRNECPEGLVFDPDTKVCNWPSEVDCDTEE